MEQNQDTLRNQITQLEQGLKRAFDSGKSFYEKKELIWRIRLLRGELDSLAGIADEVNYNSSDKH